MITFYPGPSKIEPRVGEYVKEGLESGIISMNHRSTEFMDLMKATKEVLRVKLSLPPEYQMVFTSSATECWEIIAQSVIDKKSSHLYNGAFGEKWMTYTERLGPRTENLSFDPEALPDLSLIGPSDTICITHNETSNGTAIPSSLMDELKALAAERLVAVDATSSLGGVSLDLSGGDLWYASVQKCFGLPAGLAVMICSPRAVRRAYQLNERDHYNSLPFVLDNFQKDQTPYTPNILGIYLLMRVMSDRPPVDEVYRKVQSRYSQLTQVIDQSELFSFLIGNQEVRSETVLAIRYHGSLDHLKEEARAAGIILGSGYGKWKEDTFRIANFPAIEEHEWKQLIEFLEGYG